MKKEIIYSKILLGINSEKDFIYLSPPSWDCGWYWGFGYLGNKDCHYHIDGLNKNTNLYDALKEHFKKGYNVRPSDQWGIAELFMNFYTLKETAYILGKGGSHLTTSPSKDVILNKEEATRINDVVLPHVFSEIYKILYRNKDNKTLFATFVTLDDKGDTEASYKFMIENKLTPDDFESIKGLTKDDKSRLHTKYWREFHKK